MAILKKLWRGFKRLRSKGDDYYARMRYSKYLKTLPIDEHAIVLESEHGVKCDGNIFYLLRELAKPEYGEYRIYLSARQSRISQLRDFLNDHGLERVSLLPFCSDEYYRLIASAKYLVNDTTFLPFFVKRKEQVYLNTWHGTPLKHMGKAYRRSANSLGNVQRNFLIADYLLAPNEFTRERLQDDYMLTNISDSKFVLGGYPRNEAFLDNKSRSAVRSEMGFTDNQKVIAYMPTWREYEGFEQTRAEAYLLYYLSEIDRRLDDSRIMYVNLHPLSKQSVDFGGFEHIRDFPKQYETYEFLNACDCLITDYSSVMFDYTLSGRKVILFTYDLEQYLNTRGCYINPAELGFSVARSVDELFTELNGETQETYPELIRTFNPYDGVDASVQLVHLLLGSVSTFSSDRIISIPDNGKKNVLIYTGDLAKNGMTTSLFSLLSQLDTSKCNYILTMRQNLPKESVTTLAEISQLGISYMPTLGRMNMTFTQKAAHYLFANKLLNLRLYLSIAKDAYLLDIHRLYSSMRVNHVVHFTGYEYKKILLYGHFSYPRSIFVHNNMVEEIKQKKKQRTNILRWAYQSYDHVAIVTPDMFESTKQIERRDDNIILVPNTFDFKKVQTKAREDILFDAQTKCNVTYERFYSVMNSRNRKIVSIGRFSPEKGHKRLIQSFEDISTKYRDAYLIIIGGKSFESGEWTFSELCEYVKLSHCSERIILIEYMTNPYSVVGKCDGLILPSYHEGFGLVLLEADVLGLPVVATDIPGPQTFMREHNGKLVPNSVNGVREGLEYLLSRNVRTLNVDYEQYNRNAVEAFESMLNL